MEEGIKYSKTEENYGKTEEREIGYTTLNIGDLTDIGDLGDYDGIQNIVVNKAEDYEKKIRSNPYYDEVLSTNKFSGLKSSDDVWPDKNSDVHSVNNVEENIELIKDEIHDIKNKLVIMNRSMTEMQSSLNEFMTIFRSFVGQN